MSEIIGYARTSTADQHAGLDAQIRDLKAAGCTKIYSEQVSSVAVRTELDAAMAYARAGDAFVVTKIDRLARSLTNLLQIAEDLGARGIELRILANPDLTGPTGRLMLSVIGAVAEFERSIMLERQREGIAAAKAAGKYTGRKPRAVEQVEVMRRMVAEGASKSTIAKELGVSVRSVFRLLSPIGNSRDAG